MEYRCKRCGYEWLSHLEKPKECPSCKNRKWNEENETRKSK